MMTSRSSVIDVLLAVAVVLLGATTALVLFLPHGRAWALLPLALLVVLASALLLDRRARRPDHAQAEQSHRILEIADRSLAHLRQGLNEETAGAVCRIVLAASEAAAVAITDTSRILGFAGVGEDHHEVGGPILTVATREALEKGEHRVLRNRFEIRCPNRRCALSAAIVVPLRVRSAPVGTLKFYFTSARRLTETNIAMAEGLARLLSTQLELSELDRSTELAYRMELKALQAQIDPHFLFNTINTIASLIRTDAPRARELLREFAVFYRRTLESGDDLIPLGRELEYAHTYFALEQARFGDRVELIDDVEGRHLRLLVPAFIVQPLVENAIQHGMRPEGTLHVRLSSAALGDHVTITVSDDGVGMLTGDVDRVLEPGFAKGIGIALRNVDDRLKGHFGPGSGVSVSSRPGQGAAASLTIQRSAAAAEWEEDPLEHLER